jgi:cytochrome P450
MQDLNALNYLEMVIKETLRLYPVGPFFSRTLQENVVLGGIEFPTGTSLFASPYLIGRSPEIYKDPLKFDPLRFDPANIEEKRNPFAYIPFSAGSRNCIGQKYAMIEMRSAVAKVIRNFKLTVAEENSELILSVELVLQPANGPILCATPRVYD